MIKKIYKTVKSFILASFLIYGYNIIAAPLNLIVPINFLTVCIVAFLGIPAIFGLVIILVFIA